MGNINLTSELIILIFIIIVGLHSCELALKQQDNSKDKIDCPSGSSVDMENVEILDGIGNDQDYRDTFKITFNVAFLYPVNGGATQFMSKVAQLDYSFAFLNEQFEGGVVFSYRDTIWEDTTSLYIEDLISSGNWDLENNLSSMYEDEGYINLIVLPSRGRLNGFTFRPQVNIEEPRWNRIFLSLDALGKTTLAHEVAHFLGLRHVANKEDCAADKCENLMSYCQCRDHFSNSQYDTMYSVLIGARSYLVH